MTALTLQRLGSWVVRFASGADIEDAPSGFRAIYWETALRLNVFSDYTYTLETLIQAGRNNMRVASVPVRVNHVTRPSRLIKSVPRIFLIYRPLLIFSVLGCVLGLLFLIIGGRFLYYSMQGGNGHVQSLILAAILAAGSFISFALAITGDLISTNRMLLED